MGKINRSKQTKRAIALTQRFIDQLQPGGAAYKIPDLKCPGLYLRIAPSGHRSWETLYRVRGAGVVRRKALGPFPAITIDEARSKATSLIAAAKAGRDVIAQERDDREKAARRITVAQLIDVYIKRVVKKLRTSHEIELRLRRSLISILDRHVEDLRRRDIREVLDATADRGVLREAERQRQCMGAMFSWAVAQDMLDVNPVRGLKSYGSSPPRERTLDREEIKTFWHWLDELKIAATYIDVFRVQLCVGARVGEISGMRPEEFDQENWIWRLPEARSKNKRVRLTPIVGLARNILSRRLNDAAGGPLFLSGKGLALGSNDCACTLLTWRHTIPLAHFTSHDLRRTVATRIVELGFDFETVATVLGHETGDRHTRTLTRHYIRSDFIERKRAALEAWDVELSKIISGEIGHSNIVALGERRLKASV